MKVNVIDKTGKKVSDVEIKVAGDVRNDIFKKAVLAENSLFFQEKGSDSMAGKKQVINVSKRRKKLRSTYGRGGSRTPKKTMWSRGTQFRFVGAFAAGTVGGRRAHPPRAEKNIVKNINNKEWLKAMNTGILASFSNELVTKNGQKVPANYPFVFDMSVEDIVKTKNFKDFLVTVGFEAEMKRTSLKKVRAGKGTMRGRTYKVKRGPLVVLSSVEKPAFKAARNVLGFEVITADMLMVSDFGMSEIPGRAVLFTKDALDEFIEVFNK